MEIDSGIKYNNNRYVADTVNAIDQYENKTDDVLNYWLEIKPNFVVDDNTCKVILEKLRGAKITGVKINGIFKIDTSKHGDTYESFRFINLKCRGNDIYTMANPKLAIYKIIGDMRSYLKAYVISIGPDLFDYTGTDYTS